jgi:hypothetical protein
MQAITLPWQKLSGSVPIKCVTTSADGNLVGLGLDGSLYTRNREASDWTVVANSARFTSFTPLRDGGFLAVGLDGYLYTLASVTSMYSLIAGSGTVRAAAQLRNGTIVAAGMDNLLYTRATIDGAWIQVPNSGAMISVFVLADDTIVGVGTDHQLYSWSTLTSSWGLIPNSGAMISGTEGLDGAIFGVGTDNQLYQVPRLRVGNITPGYTPIDLHNNWYKLQPTSVYWTLDPSELSRIYPYYVASLTGTYVTQLTSAIVSWLQVHTWDNWNSATDFKNAYVAFVTTYAKSLYFNDAPTGVAPRPQPPAYTTPTSPVASYKAADIFRAPPIPAFAAYVNIVDTQLDDHMLRLFLSTPFYIGPGIYDLICLNRRVVRVVLESL